MTSAPPQRLHNLPTQLTTFIGREQEIGEVERLLTTARLVTLTGAGGSGKTRLALQVVSNSLEQYPDGGWLVEFGPVANPALVPKAVASAVHIPERPGREMVDSLIDALRSKALLLVLDNCEHLLTACQELAVAILRTCPQVRILATSREGLGIPGEIHWRVPSLSLPHEIRHLPPVQDLVLYDAVRLFVDRATAAVPGFAITGENACAIVQVCQRLDGIPLAIELATARLKVLTVEQIAARLDDRFRLLTGGSNTTVPRHQTLRAAMDWSYELLSEPERAVLRGLSVFAGGWTLEAAEAVCAGGEVQAASILDLLTQLADKSLIVTETRGSDARYRLLETVRRYARDRLEEANEGDAVARRHRDWFLALAEQAFWKLRGPEAAGWLDRLETEHDNLRAAMEWSKSENEHGTAQVQLTGLLWWFWFVRGHWNEGRRWLEQAVMRTAEPLFALRVVDGAALFAYYQSDFLQAKALCERGMVLCRQIGEDTARFRWLAAFYRTSGMIALHQADLLKAEMLFDQGLTRAREVGDWFQTSLLLCLLASSRTWQGNYDSAVMLFTESLSIARKKRERFLTASVLSNQGYLFLCKRDEERASDSFVESLTLSKDLRDHVVSHGSLEGLAWLACAQGRYNRAALLLAAADALRTTTGRQFSALHEREHERYVAATRAALGDAAYTTAWAKGRTMTLEQAISDALAFVDTQRSSERPVAQMSVNGMDELTQRERDVANLIARGLTNREIGSRLHIAERTAETHVRNILNKVNANSRTQIAVWALAHGLTSPAPDQ